MVSYCYVQDVSDELNGLVIDGTTTPSDTTVEGWIEQESAQLKKDTRRIFGSETFTDEYIDYDGTGIVRTKYAPIISITSFEYESGTSSEEWTSLSEGRYSDFITYKSEGEINLNTPTYKDGMQNMRLTYVAGYSEVDDSVVKIVAKQVALRLIGTVLNEQGSSQGGAISIGSISIGDPTIFGINNVNRLESEVKTLTTTLGKSIVYRYNRI